MKNKGDTWIYEQGLWYPSENEGAAKEFGLTAREVIELYK
jgi:hypothetical protein